MQRGTEVIDDHTGSKIIKLVQAEPELALFAKYLQMPGVIPMIAAGNSDDGALAIIERAKDDLLLSDGSLNAYQAVLAANALHTLWQYANTAQVPRGFGVSITDLIPSKRTVETAMYVFYECWCEDLEAVGKRILAIRHEDS